MGNLSLKNNIMKTFKNSELELLCDLIWYLPRHHNFWYEDDKLVIYDEKWNYRKAKFEDLLNCKTFKQHLVLYFTHEFNKEKLPLNIFIKNQYLKLKDKYDFSEIMAIINVKCMTEYWIEINQKIIDNTLFNLK